MASQANQELPVREKNLFQKLIRHYDQKQFRLGIGCSKRILSKCPNHGETLSMKALIVNAMGDPDEAMTLARQGLRCNFQSATCWHVIGILESRQSNYEKALSAYKNALSKEENNGAILRDLSAILHVLRKYDDYRQVRLTMINNKPSQNQSWIGFIMANFFAGDTEVSYAVLDSFRETLEKVDEGKLDYTALYDISEVYIFCSIMLAKSNQTDAAIKYLNENEAKIFDKTARWEMLGELYIKKKDWEKAEEMYTQLLHRNCENEVYYQKMEEILDPADDDARLLMYDIISKRFPRALLPKRIPLSFLRANHPQFSTRLHSYIKAGIIKGRPALFQDLKELYSDSQKVYPIETETLKILHDNQLIPTAYPWSCYLLAQHYTNIDEYSLSLKYTQLGLDHTPTLLELLVIKAKTYKKLGEIKTAIDAILEAYNLDTADRYINCLACKYLIISGEIPRAEELLGKFVRETQSVTDYLRELQVLWFQSLAARSSFEHGDLGEALKRCHLVKRIFNDMFEDQFDFVQYCLRRNTMKAFAEFVDFEDVIMSHFAFQNASFIASQIYFLLASNPEAKSSAITKTNQTLLAISTEKSLDKKEQKTKEDDGWGPRSKEKPLLPLDLLNTPDPLGELQKFLTLLEKNAPNSTLTHAIAVKLYHEQNKTCLALRAIHKGLSLQKQTSATPSGHNKSPTAKKIYKYINQAHGLFIGNAVRFLQDFSLAQHQDTILEKLYSDLQFDSISQIQAKLNLASMDQLYYSGLEFSNQQWACSDGDIDILRKSMDKFPEIKDEILVKIKKKFLVDHGMINNEYLSKTDLHCTD